MPAQRSEKEAHREAFDVGKDLPKDDQADEQTGDGETVASQPVEIALGFIFAHEHHDGCAAIERGDGKEIESAQEKIQFNYDEQEHRYETGRAGKRIAMKELKRTADTKRQGTKNHQSEIRCGPRKSHARGSMRVTALPEGVIGSTGPANHAAGEKKSKDRDDDHAEGFAPDVGNGIQCDLATESSGVVAAELANEGVGSFMTGGREKKNQVIDESEGKVLW